jgi:energy-coupling factor transporter ATP-binding protein EcfA2
MNLKEEFKSWVLQNSAEKSGSASAYVTSLEWLSERFKENGVYAYSTIFEITEIDIINQLYDITLKIQRDSESYIYNKKAPSYGDRYFYSASLNKYREFLNNRSISKENIFMVDLFIKSLEASGLIYNHILVKRFSASLLTKPFLILTGLSGSGKTKLAQAFVQWISEDENQYKIVPVGADWTNREPLLGFPNALNSTEYIQPDSGVLELILKAKEDKGKPYFLVLDEMNLSQVERYFADFLSTMESGDSIHLYSEKTQIEGIPSNFKLPKNLFIIGTVNIDETTNMFSPKVLDRANTIEFRVDDSEMESFLSEIKEINMDVLTAKGASMATSFLNMAMDKSIEIEKAEIINGTLVNFFGELKKTGAEFGYRTATEIIRLINNLKKLDKELSDNQMLDIAIIQKLLPKLHGSRRKLVPVLIILAGFCLDGFDKIETEVLAKTEFDLTQDGVLFPLSLEKISRMYRAAIDNGFASFAEA